MKLYNSTENYFQGPDDMRNEVQMWFVAGGLLLQNLSEKAGSLPFGGLKEKIGYNERIKMKTVELLDLCSGPGNFVNHLSWIVPELSAICVDTNKKFVIDGNKAFEKFKFIEGDAVAVSLNKKFLFITASSAYHHIADKQKINFLKNIYKHLFDEGIVIICENFLPGYKNSQSREKAIKKYYSELELWYHEGNATREAIEIIGEVRNQELSQEVEHKVSFDIFKKHVAESGFLIDVDIAVWQPSSFILDNAGSHVIILKKRKI